MKQSGRRNRGVILTLEGRKKLQAAKRAAELEENNGDRFSLEELSSRMQLSLHTISRILGGSESVDKTSLQKTFTTFGLGLCKRDYTRPISTFDDLEARRSSPSYDWGEAPDASIFYGRTEELLQLRHWLLGEQCRLVTILGIGGIGKSTLAVRLGLQVQAEFDVVVWRSLQNAPPVENTLATILPFLLRALQQEMTVPDGFDGKLSTLVECLSNHRCLLILDNVETILCSNQVGNCRAGYERYGQFFKSVAAVPHTSCVVLTSREKPRELMPLEGEQTRVRCLQLRGLQTAEGRELFKQQGEFIATEPEWESLIWHYGGNPLALKMVASGTRSLYNGRIAPVLECIEQGALVFEEIGDLLECQFQRLSVLEKEVMYWLAINREPVSLAELATDIVTASSQRRLPRTIQSLLQRSLIEKSGEHFGLQPVVLEYTTQRLVEQVFQELIENRSVSLHLFQTHALIKATSKDNIRETQKQLIVRPLLEHLLIELGSPEKVTLLFQDIGVQQRHKTILLSGYTEKNVLNLLSHLQVDLAEANVQNSAFDNSLLTSNFRSVFSLTWSPDGKLLATGDMEGQIDLWQMVDGKHFLTVSGHEACVSTLDFSPDGKILASGGYDRLVKFWDVQTGDCLHKLDQHTGSVCSVSFSPDGQILASGGSDRSICLWNANTGCCIATFKGKTY